jgi:hypothetical protein
MVGAAARPYGLLMPAPAIVTYLAATEREAQRRNAAAEHRRAHSALMAQAAAEERSPEYRATRQPLLRRLLRTA